MRDFFSQGVLFSFRGFTQQGWSTFLKDFFHTTCGLSWAQLSVMEGPYRCFFCPVDYKSLKSQTNAPIKGYDATRLWHFFRATIRGLHNKTDKIKARKCLKKKNCMTGCDCHFYLISTASYDILQNCVFYLLIHAMEIWNFMTNSAIALSVAIAYLNDIRIMAFAYAIQSRKTLIWGSVQPHKDTNTTRQFRTRQYG